MGIEVAIIAIAAFFAALLTFFSGFGLGTILTPVFMVFFPANEAIALTGFVHFFNNIFKLYLVGRYADKTVVLRFGLPAIAAAILGSILLLQLTGSGPLFSYKMIGNTFTVSAVTFTISILLLIFAIIELMPAFARLQFSKDKLMLGGVLSGFFGGLTGNQGALRSAFLVRSGLSKEAYVATAVVVSTLVDMTRISVYSTNFAETGLAGNTLMIVIVTASGFLGSFLGTKLIKKVTMKFIRTLVSVLLITLALSLMTGIIQS